MGMTEVEEIRAWCESNGAVLDVDFPSITKPVAPSVLPKPQDQLIVDTVKDLLDLPKFEVLPLEVQSEPVKEKKPKVPKKEENDSSSDTK